MLWQMGRTKYMKNILNQKKNYGRGRLNNFYKLFGELIEDMGDEYWNNSYVPHKKITEGIACIRRMQWKNYPLVKN